MAALRGGLSLVRLISGGQPPPPLSRGEAARDAGLAASPADDGSAGRPRDPRESAIDFLREWLLPDDRALIRSLIEQYGPREWIWHLHDDKMADLLPRERQVAVLLAPRFGFGMKARNALRRNGYGEKELGVDDLQLIYLELIEAAVQETASCGAERESDSTESSRETNGERPR
jgi:hypothetical protein